MVPACCQVVLVNRLTDQALCVAEGEAVAQVAEAAAYGEVQKLQVRGMERGQRTVTDVGLHSWVG
jgi:hypothetical protein